MEKLIALAQHLGLEVFAFEGEYYTGATQEEIEELQEDSVSIEELTETIADQYTKLEDEFTSSGETLEYGNQEYLVLTDEEADQAWDESLENYIDECVLPELPRSYRQYFDCEKFKADCSYDGRGHTLASYDGEELEETVDGTTYFIYRTN